MTFTAAIPVLVAAIVVHILSAPSLTAQVIPGCENAQILLGSRIVLEPVGPMMARGGGGSLGVGQKGHLWLYSPTRGCALTSMDQVTWSSSSPSTIAVEPDSVSRGRVYATVRALGEGRATIGALGNGVHRGVIIVSVDMGLDAIAIAGLKDTAVTGCCTKVLVKGKTRSGYEFVFSPSGSGRRDGMSLARFRWTTSDLAVGELESSAGLPRDLATAQFRAKQPGVVEVVAELIDAPPGMAGKGLIARKRVTVIPGVHAIAMGINIPQPFTAGTRGVLIATPLLADGRPIPGKHVEWSASASGIVRIAPAVVADRNPNVLSVEAVAPGDVTITASADGVMASALVNVVPMGGVGPGSEPGGSLNPGPGNQPTGGGGGTGPGATGPGNAGSGGPSTGNTGRSAYHCVAVPAKTVKLDQIRWHSLPEPFAGLDFRVKWSSFWNIYEVMFRNRYSRTIHFNYSAQANTVPSRAMSRTHLRPQQAEGPGLGNVDGSKENASSACILVNRVRLGEADSGPYR